MRNIKLEQNIGRVLIRIFANFLFLLVLCVFLFCFCWVSAFSVKFGLKSRWTWIDCFHITKKIRFLQDNDLVTAKVVTAFQQKFFSRIYILSGWSELYGSCIQLLLSLHDISKKNNLIWYNQKNNSKINITFFSSVLRFITVSKYMVLLTF